MRADRMTLRLTRLMFGLVLCGLGIASMVLAELGLGPWDVLHQGIERLTGVPIGTVGILVGLFVLLLWIPIRERPGIGTILNVIVIGVVIDLTLLVAEPPSAFWLRILAMCAGPLLFGLGSGFYIGAGLGPGPRDGLMTGMARRGYKVGGVRTIIELTVLAIGIVLGGTAGFGTLLFAVSIGPIVQLTLGWLTLADADPEVAVSAR